MPSTSMTSADYHHINPLPPLDGGRIAVGVLPDAGASPLARLEPYGMLILIGLLFILPTLGAQTGVDVYFFNSLSQFVDEWVKLRTIFRIDVWHQVAPILLLGSP